MDGVGMSTTEMVIVVAVIVLLFGSSKVPELARSLGQAKREFSSGLREGAAKDAPAAPQPEPNAVEAGDSTASTSTTRPADSGDPNGPAAP
jgi:sec-independent protein translocase protein TatA